VVLGGEKSSHKHICVALVFDPDTESTLPLARKKIHTPTNNILISFFSRTRAHRGALTVFFLLFTNKLLPWPLNISIAMVHTGKKYCG
jgi:hypothetical protein